MVSSPLFSPAVSVLFFLPLSRSSSRQRRPQNSACCCPVSITRRENGFTFQVCFPLRKHNKAVRFFLGLHSLLLNSHDRVAQSVSLFPPRARFQLAQPPPERETTTLHRLDSGKGERDHLFDDGSCFSQIFWLSVALPPPLHPSGFASRNEKQPSRSVKVGEDDSAGVALNDGGENYFLKSLITRSPSVRPLKSQLTDSSSSL